MKPAENRNRLIKVRAVCCPACKEVIWSRHTHDFRSCGCGKSFVDGGRQYLRVGGLAVEGAKVGEPCPNVIDIWVDRGETRFWASEGRMLSHKQMTTDHIMNAIVHLRERLQHAAENKRQGRAHENTTRLEEIISEFNEELELRGYSGATH